MDPEELRRAAHEAVLVGLPARHTLTGIEMLVGQSHVPGVFSPDEAMLELVIAALDHAGVDREHPLSTTGWRERYLPEVRFQHKKVEVDRLLYALHAAASFRSGLQPALLDDTYHWSMTPLWPHATRAAVMTIRAVADGQDLTRTCEGVAMAVRPLR